MMLGKLTGAKQVLTIPMIKPTGKSNLGDEEGVKQNQRVLKEAAGFTLLYSQE
jgi:hypothetical protein